MKRDTRQDILNTAQTLFREKGYNAVSVGEIAAALGISKGNLTYYFKRKEEIVEALLESANPTFPQDPPQTLAQLDACLRDMEQARENNAFYFRSHSQLLCQGLANLAAQGLFRREAFPGEYVRVVDTVFLTAVYWLPFCEIKGEVSSFRTQAWSTLHPLLTEAGRQAVAPIVPSLGAGGTPADP